jgi:hypothetical protein
MSDDPVIRSLEARIAQLETERRPRRRWSIRRSRRLAIGVFVLAMLVPGVALASHQFTDVPDSHTFHDHIDWLADNGITDGCGDGRFCPNSAVTRGQMAAFMRRMSSEFELVTNTVDPNSVEDAFSGSATCPGDKRAIAGGGSTDTINLFVTDSYPDGGSWWVHWETDDSAGADVNSLTVYALCAPRL